MFGTMFLNRIFCFEMYYDLTSDQLKQKKKHTLFVSLVMEKWPEYLKHFHSLFQNNVQVLKMWFSLVCWAWLNFLETKCLFRSLFCWRGVPAVCSVFSSWMSQTAFIRLQRGSCVGLSAVPHCPPREALAQVCEKSRNYWTRLKECAACVEGGEWDIQWCKDYRSEKPVRECWGKGELLLGQYWRCPEASLDSMLSNKNGVGSRVFYSLEQATWWRWESFLKNMKT